MLLFIWGLGVASAFRNIQLDNGWPVHTAYSIASEYNRGNPDAYRDWLVDTVRQPSKGVVHMHWMTWRPVAASILKHVEVLLTGLCTAYNRLVAGMRCPGGLERVAGGSSAPARPCYFVCI